MADASLYYLAENCQTVEDLVGNASELTEFTNQRSWIMARWCARANELGGGSGIKEISKVLPLSMRTCQHYASVWEKYQHLRDTYPRLSFSYFKECYNAGLTKDDASKALSHADTCELKIPAFPKMIKGEREEEFWVCDKCGSRHKVKS